MIRLKFLIVFLSFFAFSGFAKAEYLREDDLTSLIYSCYIERDIPVFCSTQQIDDPHLKVYLPLFKSVMLDNKIHAFRIMATIENLSKKNLIGAKVKLNFKGEQDGDIEFIINQRVKYKMTSSTDHSHLIRSDIPNIRSSYDKLHEAYYNADISNFDMTITELYFQ